MLLLFFPCSGLVDCYALEELSGSWILTNTLQLSKLHFAGININDIIIIIIIIIREKVAIILLSDRLLRAVVCHYNFRCRFRSISIGFSPVLNLESCGL